MGRTILIDIDDTIINLLPSWLAWLNNKYKLDIVADEIVDWDISLWYPFQTTAQIWEPLYINEFWDTVAPKKDAQKYIKKLIDDGNEIFLCSASNSKSMSYKLTNCVFKHFPYLSDKNIIIIPTGKKKMIKADYLIDDYVGNLIDGEYTGLLYSTFHNRNLDVSQYENIHRVHNWEQIYKLIS